MSHLWLVPLWLAIILDMLGPVVLLLLVKRWTGKWRFAALVCLVAATVLSFLLTVAIGWLTTALQQCVRGDWDSPRLLRAFPLCGVLGPMFGATGLLFTLPL